MHLESKELARRGEALAARYLEERGYQIVARNWRVRGGEIDLIATAGEQIVFIEVKTRSGRGFPAAEGVDGRKQHRIRALALQWLSQARLHGSPVRFDVLAVYMARTPPYAARVEHLEGAF